MVNVPDGCARCWQPRQMSDIRGPEEIIDSAWSPERNVSTIVSLDGWLIPIVIHTRFKSQSRLLFCRSVCLVVNIMGATVWGGLLAEYCCIFYYFNLHDICGIMTLICNGIFVRLMNDLGHDMNPWKYSFENFSLIRADIELFALFQRERYWADSVWRRVKNK